MKLRELKEKFFALSEEERNAVLFLVWEKEHLIKHHYSEEMEEIAKTITERRWWITEQGIESII